MIGQKSLDLLTEAGYARSEPLKSFYVARIIDRIAARDCQFVSADRFWAALVYRSDRAE